MNMTTKPKRFLFPMWEGGGTIPPQLGLARRLLERGHQVHVLADPTVEDDARAAGCTFSPWETAPHRTSLDPADDLLRDWEVSNPLAMLKRVRDVFVATPAGDYAADTRDAIASTRPHAVVPDFMLFGAIMAAQAARLPVAPVITNIWMLPTRGAPAIGPGFAPPTSALGRTRNAVMLALANRVFDAALPTLNQARATHGLPPLTSFYEQVIDTPRILVLTSPTFDFSSPTVPGNARYVGPVLDEPCWTQPWRSPWPADHPDPLILVGFSSTFQDQGPVLRRVVEALSTLPVRAVVTLGQMLHPDEVASTDNVYVVSSAPHDQILEHASLVVTHCGHGTTLRALAAGVPLVCIPMGRDQNDTAARVVHHGAGVRVTPRSSAKAIRAAVEQVLHDRRYRSNATRLAQVIAEEARHVDVVDELERLTDTAVHVPRTA
jgi:MGT family glycosyltransferase